MAYLRQMYGTVFGKVVSCGKLSENKNMSKPDIIYNVEKGFYGYHCPAKGIEKFPDFQGKYCLLNLMLPLG